MKLEHFAMMSDFEAEIWDRATDMGLTPDEFWHDYLNGDDMGSWNILNRDGKKVMEVESIDAASVIVSGNDALRIEYASNLDMHRDGDYELRPMEADGVTL